MREFYCLNGSFLGNLFGGPQPHRVLSAYDHDVVVQHSDGQSDRKFDLTTVGSERKDRGMISHFALSDAGQKADSVSRMDGAVLRRDNLLDESSYEAALWV